MKEAEKNLLNRLVEKDAEALSQITQHYAGLVYGVSLRIIGDKNMAAEATRQTFAELAQQAGAIKESLIAWLHRTATDAAAEILHRDKRRRMWEQDYTYVKQLPVEKWEDLLFYIDGAIDEMDDESRELLLLHFFDKQSLTDIANEKQLSQQIVSGKKDTAVSTLRDNLQKRGVIVTIELLVSLMSENAAQAAPDNVLNGLERAAQTVSVPAGTAPAEATEETSPAAEAATPAEFGIKTPIAITATIVVIVIAGLAVYRNINKEKIKQVEEPAALTQPQSPVPDIAQRVEQVQPPERRQNRPMPTREPTRPQTDSNERRDVAQQVQPAQQQAVEIDLSSPQATIQSFAKVLASGDFGRISELFQPRSEGLSELTNILQSDNAESAETKQVFSSLGEPVEITNATAAGADGANVTWTFTVTKPFTAGGVNYAQGSRFVEMSATLINVDGPLAHEINMKNNALRLRKVKKCGF